MGPIKNSNTFKTRKATIGIQQKINVKCTCLEKIDTMFVDCQNK